MLVVVGIIAILVTIMVPQVGRARIKALEGVLQANCASIESALANYAATHDGNYPGVALDVMAPYSDYALGDPVLYQGSDPPPGGFSHGVLGGTGSFNAFSEPVRVQLKRVKDLVLGQAPLETPRYFDSLIAGDAIQEYPQNPFKKSGTTDANRMMNVFGFVGQMPGGPNDLTQFQPYILVNASANASPGQIVPDPRFPGRSRIIGNYDNLFGEDPDDSGSIINASGDFAYVPILSLSAAPFADNPMTPEDDRYRWGTNVAGYMLFGFGHHTNKTDKYRPEQEKFGREGLPGFGFDTGGPVNAPACDTPYEQAVFALFDTAIYFQQKP